MDFLNNSTILFFIGVVILGVAYLLILNYRQTHGFSYFNKDEMMGNDSRGIVPKQDYKTPIHEQDNKKTSPSASKMSKVDFYSFPGTYELDRFKDDPNPNPRPIDFKQISSENIEFMNPWEAFKKSYKETVVDKNKEESKK